jgi:anti-sigma F factor antagonist
MTLSHLVQNEVLVITIEEPHLDAASAPYIKTKISDLVSSYKLKDLVLNLEKVTFIDSSGIGALIGLEKEIQKLGGDMKLCHMTNTVRTIFEMVQLHRIFEVYPSQQHAVRAFSI